ncbi:RrF2 family transcriptional regulator [Sphingoaurantiacus capsulatus]|uniref:RrF2 family transcriptional regulator n=1 Tax=Sphingoaurantiacus capsulatus TaxID=1771310 RepID=A0ABV7X6V6_9SPHN
MLSQRTRYALRSLIMLAGGSADAPQQIATISATERVPRKFLELILLDLKRAGIVESTRGRSGGYRLARAAKDISFGEVIRLLDGPLALVPCASLTAYAPCGDCQDEVTCAIRRAALVVREESARVLDGFSLADAVRREANAIAAL